MDIEDLAAYTGVVQRQNQIRRTDAVAAQISNLSSELKRAGEREAAERAREKAREAAEPDCPYCGGKVCEGFQKCKNCASDLIWFAGLVGKPGEEILLQQEDEERKLVAAAAAARAVAAADAAATAAARAAFLKKAKEEKEARDFNNMLIMVGVPILVIILVLIVAEIHSTNKTKAAERIAASLRLKEQAEETEKEEAARTKLTLLAYERKQAEDEKRKWAEDARKWEDERRQAEDVKRERAEEERKWKDERKREDEREREDERKQAEDKKRKRAEDAESILREALREAEYKKRTLLMAKYALGDKVYNKVAYDIGLDGIIKAHSELLVIGKDRNGLFVRDKYNLRDAYDKREFHIDPSLVSRNPAE